MIKTIPSASNFDVTLQCLLISGQNELAGLIKATKITLNLEKKSPIITVVLKGIFEKPHLFFTEKIEKTVTFTRSFFDLMQIKDLLNHSSYTGQLTYSPEVKA